MSTVQEMENGIQGKQMHQQEEEEKSGVLNPRSLGGSMAKGMLLTGVSQPGMWFKGRNDENPRLSWVQ